MNLAKTSQYLLIIYFAFLIAIKPVSLIAFWILTIFGLYWIIKDKINPFKIKYAKYAAILPLFYFFTMFISNILSTMPESKFSNLGRVLYLLFSPLIVVVIYKINFPFKKFINTMKISSIIIGSIVLTQLILNGFIIHRYGGMYNVNTYGDIAVFFTLFSIININNENKKDFIFSVISFLFGLSAIILSGSRGSLLSFLILLLIFTILNFIYFKESRSKIIYLFSITLILVSSIFFTTNYFKNRVHTATHQIQNWEKGKDKTSSVATRLVMWTKGIEAFKDKPIIGYGYHNAIPAISKYIEDKKVKERYKAHWHLHNEIINTMVNSGIIGLIALLALYIVPIKIFLNNLKKHTSPSIAGIILMSGFIVMGITHTLFGYEYETSLFVIMLSYLFLKLNHPKYKKILKPT